MLFLGFCKKFYAYITFISLVDSNQATLSPAPQRKKVGRSGDGTQQPTKKRSRKEDIEDVLLQCFKESRERQIARAKEKEAEKLDQKNPEYHYGMEIARTLNEMPPREKAIAKLKIIQVITDIQFPPDYPPPIPPQPTDYYPPNY